MGSSVFCTDPAQTDGTKTSFQLRNTDRLTPADLAAAARVRGPEATAAAGQSFRPLYRCYSGAQHFFSLRADCEGAGHAEGILGYVAQQRTGDAPRGLYRCRSASPGACARARARPLCSILSFSHPWSPRSHVTHWALPHLPLAAAANVWFHSLDLACERVGAQPDAFMGFVR